MSRPFLDLGEGLEVRILDPIDAPELFDLIDSDRDHLRPWMPWADTTGGIEDVRTFLEASRATEDLDGLGILLDGTLVGGIGLRSEASGVDGELGCWIEEGVEGRGLASRACRAMIRHAFDELGLHRVTCLVATDNARSRAMVERLGFIQEGVVREGARSIDGFRDLVLYGLLERDGRA